MQTGHTQVADSALRRKTFTDFHSWVSFNPTNSYVYYALEHFVISKVTDLDGSNLIYREWFTLDTVEEDTARQVMTLWLVLANIGGIQQVFLMATVWIFSYYS